MDKDITKGVTWNLTKSWEGDRKREIHPNLNLNFS
jgi:hypothetical protein